MTFFEQLFRSKQIKSLISQFSHQTPLCFQPFTDVPTDAPSTCDDPFFFLPESGTCIHYGSSITDHSGAVSYCQGMGARLVKKIGGSNHNFCFLKKFVIRSGTFTLNRVTLHSIMPYFVKYRKFVT